MALALLNCSICPKQPSFSDTSHLLTHVSSKGHLSHLHRLQVRSHQEIAAGVQLASYNQWYQQHGLGTLLSDRLLSKDARKSQKRPAIKKKDAKVKHEAIFVDEEQYSSPLRGAESSIRGRGRKSTKSKVGRFQHLQGDSDMDYSPVQKSKRAQRSAYLMTPVKRYSSVTSYHISDEDCPAEDDPAFLLVVATPQNAKLKGVIWPGMDLFDAATEEEQRRRNQKKDGSVVKRMERYSRLVQATEVVYSPGGTLRKERHMDDLDDASSLIEGESPLMKQPPRRKRAPLARKSVNIPRLVKRKSKIVKAKAKFPSVEANALPPMAYVPSSSTNTSNELQSRYSPTADENMEFKLTVGNMSSSRKKRGNFTIFNDNSPEYAPNFSMTHNQSGLPLLGHPYIVPAQPRLSFHAAPWLQPQYQQQLYYDNHYTNYRPQYPTYSELQDVGVGKENIVPTIGRSTERETQNANPLTWKSATPDQQIPTHSSEATFEGFMNYFGSTSNLEDPFGYTKNPLADAFAHLAYGKPAEHKSRFKSPDGTISEHDTASQRAVFPTVE